MNTNINTNVDFGTNNSNTNTNSSIGITPNNNQSTYQNTSPTRNNVQTESMDLSFATEQVANESKSILDSIGDFFSDLGEGLKNTGASIVDGAKTVANWAITGLKDLGSNIKEACSNLASNVTSILGSALSWAKDTYVSLKATEAVIVTTIISGIADIGEGIVDGLAWTGGKLVEGGSWLVGKVAGWFSDDAEETIMDWRDQAKTDVKEFIATDWIGEANDWFYQETGIGKAINENSYLKYDSEVAQGIRTITEKVAVFAAATAATMLTGGAITPLLVGGLGFSYGTGNAAENTYATKATKTSTIDELLILANGGISALSWYTSGQLGKGFIEIGKAMKEASVKEIIAQMGKEIFSKEMLKELISPGNVVGNAIGTLMQTGGAIAFIATKVYNGQEVSDKEWLLLIGELIIYFGLNVVEDAISREITGFKAPNSMIAKNKMTALENDVLLNVKEPYSPTTTTQLADDAIEIHNLKQRRIIESSEDFIDTLEDTSLGFNFSKYTSDVQKQEFEMARDKYNESFILTEQTIDGLNNNQSNQPMQLINTEHLKEVEKLQQKRIREDYLSFFKDAKRITLEEIATLQKKKIHETLSAEEKRRIAYTYLTNNIGLDVENIPNEVLELKFEKIDDFNLSKRDERIKNVCIKDIIGTTDSNVDVSKRKGNLLDFLLMSYSTDNSYYGRTIDGYLDNMENDLRKNIQNMYSTYNIGDRVSEDLDISLIERDGKFFVLTNGNHRIETMRIKYATEIAAAKSAEEIEAINQKYTFKMAVSSNDDTIVDVLESTPNISFSTHEKKLLLSRINSSTKENLNKFKDDISEFLSESQKDKIDELINQKDLFVIDESGKTGDLLSFNNESKRIIINIQSEKIKTDSVIELSNHINSEELKKVVFNYLVEQKNISETTQILYNDMLDEVLLKKYQNFGSVHDLIADPKSKESLFNGNLEEYLQSNNRTRLIYEQNAKALEIIKSNPSLLANNGTITSSDLDLNVILRKTFNSNNPLEIDKIVTQVQSIDKYGELDSFFRSYLLEIKNSDQNLDNINIYQENRDIFNEIIECCQSQNIINPMILDKLKMIQPYIN